MVDVVLVRVLQNLSFFFGFKLIICQTKFLEFIVNTFVNNIIDL